MFCSAFVLYWILCAWLASFQIKKKNPPYMDWKLYLFISSLKRLSMKCADRAFTLLLSILITFSTESLPSTISSSIVNGAFWWWALDAVPDSSQAVSIALCGKPQSCNSGSKEAGLVHGFDPLKGISNNLKGSWYQTWWETHHSHLPAGYLSGRPCFESYVWSELLRLVRESLSANWASQEMVSGLLDPF